MIDLSQPFANEETISIRQLICNSCLNRKFGICLECGCVLEVKIRCGFSSCPLGKWDSVKTNKEEK